MRVYVLLDDSTPPIVYAVVTDAGTVEEWLELDGSFGAVECEVDDYTAYNDAVEAIEGEAEQRRVVANSSRSQISTFVREHPELSYATVARRFKVDPSYVSRIAKDIGLPRRC
jgi:hypothetical protein